MALEAEIELIRKDTEGWRSLAVRLLAQINPGDLRDQDLDFLEQIPARPWLLELSYRQAKYLLDLRDSLTLVSNIDNQSVSLMIRRCLENLAELPEGENEQEEKGWIQDLAHRKPQQLRRHEASRLHSLAKQIGHDH